jgi:hypothetical protein
MILAKPLPSDPSDDVQHSALSILDGEVDAIEEDCNGKEDTRSGPPVNKTGSPSKRPELSTLCDSATSPSSESDPVLDTSCGAASSVTSGSTDQNLHTIDLDIDPLDPTQSTVPPPNWNDSDGQLPVLNDPSILLIDSDLSSNWMHDGHSSQHFPNAPILGNELDSTLYNRLELNNLNFGILRQSFGQDAYHPVATDDDAWDTTPSLEFNPKTATSTDSLTLDPAFSLDGMELLPIYPQPPFQRGSLETVGRLFARQTSTILCVKNETNDNPWLTLVLPLAVNYPALFHAIAAMTFLHMGKISPQCRSEGVWHAQQSKQSLVTTKHTGTTSLEVALAATLALGFAETWDYDRSSTGIDHIKEAKALVEKALLQHQKTRRPSGDLTRLKFLANTWIYMDVIARFTSDNPNTSVDIDLMRACSRLGARPPESEIDALMGCAATLFPTIGRVADLVTRIRKSTKRNSPTVISQALELKTLIENWVPPVDLAAIGYGPSDLSDAVQLAEAYRWATLLLLRQAIPELPSFLSIEELSQKVLVFLATIPVTSRTKTVQIFPLMAAGPEALDEEDREWVRDRWRIMAKLMITGIVDRCLEVTAEVWKRRDEFKARLESQQSTATLSQSFAKSTEHTSTIDSASLDPLRRCLAFADVFGGHTAGRCPCTQAGCLCSGSSAFVGSKLSPRETDDISRTGCMEYTVKGRLHWLTVMKDRNWESKYPLGNATFPF